MEEEKKGIVLRCHVRRLYTDNRDNSLNILLTVFENQNEEGLLQLRDKSIEVGMVLLPDET